jgi:ribosome-associated heat shock protein Hsp15
MADEDELLGGGQRIDRWLWYTRLLKSRTLAAALVTSGKLRVNGERAAKASRLVRPNDVLTFPLGSHIRVIKVLKPGTRRGPAPEAQTLYEDLDPPRPRAESEGPKSGPVREAGSGRPTKKDRRQTDALRGDDE